MQYQHGSWNIDFPEHWQLEKADECVVIYRNKDVGAFQISSYPKKQGAISQEDLLRFSKVPDAEAIKIGDIPGLYKQAQDDEHISYSWWLNGGRELIYATYVCALGHEAEEAHEREQIIQSLRVA